MSEFIHIPSAKSSFFATLILVAVGLAFLAPKAAVNVDEQLHYPHAKRVVNWYFTGGEDQSCLHTPETNLKYYGQSVDNFTALINRVFHVQNEFLTRHFTGAFFFWLLLLFTGLLARKISGSWQVALASVLALVFMPRLAGQAFGNLKDIPFATGYMAGLLMTVQFLKELPCPKWSTILLLGAAIAFTVSVRAGGFILFAYLGLSMLLFFILKPFYLKQIVSTKPVFVRLVGQGAVILAVGYFAGLLFWPYALQNIFVHPLESLRVMEQYKVSIRQLFEGEIFWSTQLPWYYLPKWILISTPLFVLTGFALFVWFFFNEMVLQKEWTQKLIAEGFVLFSFVFPFFYVIAIDSNLYSGVRQLLFILPPLAIISVTGTYRFIKLLRKKNKVAANIAFTGFLFLLVLPLKHQANTFPADYVYFNPLFGGNKKAWGSYEYDYYFHAVKKPVEEVIVLAGESEITVAMNSNLSNYFDAHPNIRFKYTRFWERSSLDWEYGIFGINYLHPHLLKNNTWQPAGIVKTYYHRGNPVAVLIKRTDKTDFRGISEIKNGNLHEGKQLLEKAVGKEPHNVWLFVHLAQAELALGNSPEFESYLNQGKEIHPFFEPFFLLEATRLFNEGKIQESHAELKQLLEINPRYLPAKPLYEEIKKSMN